MIFNKEKSLNEIAIAKSNNKSTHKEKSQMNVDLLKTASQKTYIISFKMLTSLGMHNEICFGHCTISTSILLM